MSEIKFTDQHEAVKVEQDIAWVGITQYAQEALGDLVFIELPPKGKIVKKGQYFAVVESVKAASEVYSPVDGEVVEINTAMESDLEMIKKPLHEDGWIAKIRCTDAKQIESLMDEATYQTYLKNL